MLAGLVGVVRARERAVVIATIDGTAGVGKTALGVHWAHQTASQFPDGQLYVNLRGFHPSASPMTVGEAVRGFLDAFQVPSERVPASTQAQVSLYRSIVADRRVLVLLDNAATAEQVRPLLPGSPSCLALITCRNRLSSLAAVEGAHPLTLDVLTPDEAHDQLANHLGSARVLAEPDAINEIITCCAGLPLALAIAAARAAAHPTFALAVLAGELRDARGGLSAFDDGDVTTDLRTVLSWSYEKLSATAAGLLRLLGLHPGPDIAVPAAASLAGLTASQVRGPLAELARAHLVAEHVPGRFGFHDLLRAYAVEQARQRDTDGQRHDAIGRALDHYLHTAHAAAVLLNPHRDRVGLPPPSRAVSPEHIADHHQALAWFTAERATLLAVVAQAATEGFDTHIPPLAWCLTIFFQRRGHWQDWAAVQHAAIDAAGRLSDWSAAAHAHRDLARAYLPQRRFDDAHEHLTRALDLYRSLGDHKGQAQTHLNLGMLFERRGSHHEALRHTQQARDLFYTAGNELMYARALNAIGWLHAQLGRYQRTTTSCEQALSILEKLDDRYGQAATWDSLGFAYRHLGEHRQALISYQQALDLRRQLGDRSSQATVLTHLGDTYHAVEDREAARDAWRQGLAILEELQLSGAEQLRAKLALLNDDDTQ
jgi:tetratricopeptide (TPR) repeat protein